MALLPAKNVLDGTKAPATTTGEMKLALGNLRDFIAGLLGTDSADKSAARAALGVTATGDALVVAADAASGRTTLVAAKSGANTDITSVGAITGVTAAVGDNTTKLSTTAFVLANGTASASETVAGKAEIATQAEVNTATDDLRIVTPLKLLGSSVRSLEVSGYIKFPSWLGGFMLQWGTFSVAAGGGTVTFPTSFIANCFGVFPIATATNSPYITVDNVIGGSATFKGWNSGGSPAAVGKYFAIGN